MATAQFDQCVGLQVEENEDQQGQRVTIYTDGACIGNPGPGGYAAILTRGDDRKTVRGRSLDTTNNRMELMGAIEALRAMTIRSPVTIVSDSTYVVNGINEWLSAWKARGWKRARKGAISNLDLWQELDELVASRTSGVICKWVRGHNGHVLNEKADKIADEEAAAALKQARQLGPR
jgi:ribonuclease HI